jgi:dienelactone hydrolase
MQRWQWLIAAAAAVLLLGHSAPAQEIVHFPSLDGNAATLDGYLFQPAGAGRHPALVFLHGCGGLINRRTGDLGVSLRAWAVALTGDGYAVLMVDSFTPRGVSSTCAPSTYNRTIVEARPGDAYGALRYLQAQPFVRGDRIGLIGWSAGGGSVLLTIPKQSRDRPAALPGGDFRAAVAFYPALCNEQRQPAAWTTDIPLLVLLGAADVWTPAAPCQSFVAGAVARGASIEMHVYPGAYHEFDAPNLPVHELPQDRTPAGVVPIVGTDPAARADALVQVPAFLARHLGD